MIESCGDGEQRWVFDSRDDVDVTGRLGLVMATAMLPFESHVRQRGPVQRHGRLSLTRVPVGPLSLVSCDVPDVFSGRAGAITGSKRDNRIAVALVMSGAQHITGERSSSSVNPGDIFVFDGGEEAHIDIPRRVRAHVLIAPRAHVVGSVVGVSGHLSAQRPVTRLLRHHLAELGRSATLLSLSEREAVSAATTDILRLALAQPCDAGGSERTTVGAAMLPGILLFVERHLDDYGLDVKRIASEFSISLRTVHSLFNGTGETAAAYIRRRRLERIRADIAAHPRVPVAVLGAKWGYPNGSGLTRAYRRQFGLAPSEQRTVSAQRF